MGGLKFDQWALKELALCGDAVRNGAMLSRYVTWLAWLLEIRRRADLSCLHGEINWPVFLAVVDGAGQLA